MRTLMVNPDDFPSLKTTQLHQNKGDQWILSLRVSVELLHSCVKATHYCWLSDTVESV